MEFVDTDELPFEKDFQLLLQARSKREESKPCNTILAIQKSIISITKEQISGNILSHKGIAICNSFDEEMSNMKYSSVLKNKSKIFFLIKQE